MNEERRLQEALWRYSVLGPLVSAELEHGDVRRLCEAAAERLHRKPTGQRVRLSARTIEGWYYAYKADGLQGLRPKGRSDAGHSRAISPEVAERVIALKREKPRRSIRRIIKMLVRARQVEEGHLTKSSVHRLLQAHGISERPRRIPETQRKAFRHPFAGDCFMGDVMHGGRKAIDAGGKPRKTYLHAFIDSATRLVVGARFRFGETAGDFESTLKAAVRKHGPPRKLYLDNGAAQRARSLQTICADLGIHLAHCDAYDPQAKGAIERFFGTYRAEVEDEIDEGAELTLDELNAQLWAWLSTEYHRRKHGGTRRVPLDHWLEQVEHLRPAPALDELERIFLHRATRKVRPDSTISFAGHDLEVRGELVGREIELRLSPDRAFDPEDRSTYPAVYVDGRPFCDTVLLDPIRNSSCKRRKLESPDTEGDIETDIDPLEQLLDEHARLKTPGKR